MENMSAIGAGSNVDELKEQQKKSSAIETLFTMVLVVFSYIQATVTVTGPVMNDFYEKMLFLVLTIATSGVLYIAWKIGGDNLMEVFFHETGFKPPKSLKSLDKYREEQP